MTNQRSGSPPRVDGVAARRRARDRSLVRNGIVLLVAVAAMAVAWVVREVPNDARPAAVDLTQRLDAVYRDVRAGDQALGTTPAVVAPGITGARFERRTAGDRWVLVGEAASDCYVLWWDETGDRRVRTLAGRLPCEPSTLAMSASPDTFGRIGRVVDEEQPSAAWEEVLPDPTRLRFWFLPAMVVGGGVVLSALVRSSIALLTGDAPSATRR